VDLSYPGARQRLLGRKYLMLRRDIRRFVRGASSPEPKAGERLRVVVTFGGSDPIHATARTVAMFPPERPLELGVIAGPGFRDTSALDAAIATARAAGHVVHLHTSPPDPGALFVAAHAAVCSAGGTLGELAYLGCPALAYAIVPDQIAPARRQVDGGMIAGGKPWADVDDDMLRSELLRFVQDDAGRRVQREHALASVDGEGPRRIIAAAIE
jgi:spore coat polysaccharide biosynthesis predicted glycosyltransferase SpsG